MASQPAAMDPPVAQVATPGPLRDGTTDTRSAALVEAHDRDEAVSSAATNKQRN